MNSWSSRKIKKSNEQIDAKYVVFYATYMTINELKRLPFFVLILFSNLLCFSQSIEGIVTDDLGVPVPYATIYIKNRPELRTVTSDKGNYTLFIEVGSYDVVVKYLGFETLEQFVVVRQGSNKIDFQLKPADNELNEIEIKVKRTNPGHEIIKKVIERKDIINPEQYSYSVDVYLKAAEKRAISEKRSKQEIEEELDKITDPFEREEKEKELRYATTDNLNLVEVEMERHFQPPNNVKEIRNAYVRKGKDDRLYYTTTTKSNFNFFANILYVDDLNESPVTSPISWAGILSYKYKLVRQYVEEGVKYHKIEIAARNSATSTLTGYLIIQDSAWMVKELSFRMEKGDLLKFDYFEIDQLFENRGDTLCVLKQQNMRYGVSFNKDVTEASTSVAYDNYVFGKEYGKKFFSNEVAVTTQDAYDKDSAFWESNRRIQLTEEERELLRKQDSIHAVLNKKEYLDSVDKEFNRVTFWKVVWFGIDQRNRAKKIQWSVSSLAGMIEPIYIAGPRISPNFDYFKKWENEKYIDTYGKVSVGVLNGDIKGTARVRYLYDPFRQSAVFLRFRHDFDLIRQQDAISQIFLRDNFIESTKLVGGHYTELLNGLYLDAEVEFNERRSVDGYKFITLLDSAINNTAPPVFKTYQALLLRLIVEYTPGQKYMREPKRKVILGSKWPTFYIGYEKGIPGFLGSDVDHDYIDLGVRQSFKIGTLGTTNYHAKTGKFLNARILKDPDYKYHRRSDPLWFSNPLYSYQGLDTSLPTMDFYLETHIVHHFNGALLNKIPFMKKTRIKSVVGGGYLYVPEHNYQYWEFFAGLERDFKLFKRRLRIGLYGVYSDANFSPPTGQFKISFSLLDERDMKYNF